MARTIAIGLGRGEAWRDIRQQLTQGDFRAAITDLLHDLRVSHNTLGAHVVVAVDQAVTADGAYVATNDQVEYGYLGEPSFSYTVWCWCCCCFDLADRWLE